MLQSSGSVEFTLHVINVDITQACLSDTNNTINKRKKLTIRYLYFRIKIIILII